MKPLKKEQWFKITALAITAVVVSTAILVGMALLLTSCDSVESAMEFFTLNIHPAAPSTYDVGNPTNRYRAGYFDNVTGLKYFSTDNGSIGELWVTDNTSIHTIDGSGFGGLPGPQGPAGPTGPQGGQGDPGIAVISTSTNTTITSGTLLGSDGTHITSVTNTLHTQGTDTTLGITSADIQIGSGYNINLINSLTSNGTWSGLVSSYTAGGTIVQWDLVYIDSSGKVEKANAGAAATVPVIGMATASVSTNDPVIILTYGYVRYDTWNWTVNGLIYASATAGQLTQTAPTGTGKQIDVVGVAITSHIILLNPNYMILELK
jgi:hypothetical protein